MRTLKRMIFAGFIVDLSAIYGRLLSRFGGFMEEKRLAMMLLDGELLPWRALGEGLIERQFKPIGKVLETELMFLQQNGFEEAYGKLIGEYDASDFAKDPHHTTKSALSDKYGSSVYQTYTHIHTVRPTYVPLSTHLEAYQTYKRQLELYAEEGDMAYKSFAVLKLVYEDGRRRFLNGKPPKCTASCRRMRRLC